MSPSEINQIRRKLLRWYDKTRRDLPWRRTRDPYAIWVAETMLQRTQVGTVLPYYRRGDFNQALLELGAKVCVAVSPKRANWPIAPHCAARSRVRFRLKQPSLLKRKIQKIEWPLLIIQDNGKILLRRRPAGALLGELWEVPGGAGRNGESLKALRLARER